MSPPSTCDNYIQLSGNYKERRFGGKIDAIINSPYERTIFLDIDTLTIRPLIFDLFDVSSQKDLMATMEPGNAFGSKDESLRHDIPHCFPGMNTGVIAFKKNTQTDKLFSRWKKLYIENKRGISNRHDQESFRKSLYETNILFSTLCKRFNVRGRNHYISGKPHSVTIHNVKQLYGAIKLVQESTPKADKYNITKNTKILINKLKEKKFRVDTDNNQKPDEILGYSNLHPNYETK